MNLDPSITLNPAASAPHLILLFLIAAAFLGWSAWKSAAQASPAARLLIVGCRVLLVGALLAIALNPGRWIEKREETEQFWTILADASLSMGTEDGPEDDSRWEAGARLAEEARGAAENPGDVGVFTFDSGLRRAAEPDLSSARPEGEATDLAASADALLNLARNRAGRHAGTLVFSDGRQTGDSAAFERVALRARAMESPFYVLPLGGEVKPEDLSVRAAHRQFVAFAGQECTVTAKLKAEGLGPIRPELILADADGREIERRQVELKPSQEEEVRFTFPAPEPGVHLLKFSSPEWPGERVLANNAADCTLTVLQGDTRIFMAEGEPYWDSKFLAQMIRNRKHMQIISVYRLAEDRFFRVETGDERPSQEAENVFPDTAEALRPYDLVVLGKGAEYFLDEKRLALLGEWVRDRGGSLLFTRGKPYRGTFEGMEFLEAVEWGDPIGRPMQLQPTEAGEAAGLFGDLLPGVDDPLWRELPPLRESHRCSEVKPFTEILLEGTWDLDGRERTVPVLMSRRFGRGMTVTLNADGLWQWDFFPSEQGVEGQYEEFWSQLIQWAITFSEFLPGQDLSLHLDESVVRAGDHVRARIGYRGTTGSNGEPDPALALYRDSERLREIPAAKPGEAAVRWEAGITLDRPGAYRVQAIDRADREAPGPSLPLTVLPPPGETERLSADPEFLRRFADLSGGRLISPEEIEDIAAKLSMPEEAIDRSKAEWEPAWDTWHSFSIVLFIAAAEWFTRRRTGSL